MCPEGFEWFDSERCISFPNVSIASIASNASKTDARNICKSRHPSAQLIQPKTIFAQRSFEQFEQSYLNVFLGMTLIDGNWFWDNGQNVSSESKNLLISLCPF